MYADEAIQAVRELCRKHSAIQVILFGSRAKGTAQPTSDIDIAVSGVQEIDLLLEEIEMLPTLYTVDIVDLDTCKNELLLEDIRKYGQQI
ncbi:MAG: nucleotidyltransferase domain-containing protein [Hespellia sp.]|nr:nucleotidyltransferase domain-containing protein [Hespellia sp.]